MTSRLRQAINQQNREKLYKILKKGKDPSSVEPAGRYYNHNLPFPRKLLGSPHQHNNYYGQSTNTPQGHSTARIIGSSTEIKNRHNEWMMMREHCLWVRIFDEHDNLLFNHANPQSMATSQMIRLCTKLVNHLNLISQTNELKVQEALGTLEETIIAQLTPPLEGQMKYHAWNLQKQGNINTVNETEAIAVIRQTHDGAFNGQLVDDMIGTTFQL